MGTMNGERCPCGCGLTAEDIRLGWYTGTEEARLNLHLATHRLMAAVCRAFLRDLDRVLKRFRI